jgi:hypothetical protein
MPFVNTATRDGAVPAISPVIRAEGGRTNRDGSHQDHTSSGTREGGITGLNEAHRIAVVVLADLFWLYTDAEIRIKCILQ